MDKEYAEFKDGETRGIVNMMTLATSWKFNADPDGAGPEKCWQKTDLDDSEWENIKANAPEGWLEQGHPDYHGYGWYRQAVNIKPDFLARSNVCLFFGGVDKEAEVFVNGEKAFIHDHASMGLIPGQTYNLPFSFDVKKYLKPGGNVIAVRVYSWRTGAGMHKNAFLFSSDIPLSHNVLCRHLLDMGELDKKSFDQWCFDYIPPEPESDQHLFGSRVQRTMSLLATSSPANRRTVKILFYGQSITAGMHWRKLVRQLQETYPYANIVAENRSIGGWGAPSLVRSAVQDLYPFYPDLVFFHVYGGETTGELERIFCNIRKYTTAEIMIFTHTYREQPSDEDEYSAQCNRYLAQKYDCEIIEVREAWNRYLEKNKLPARALLADNIHPNAWGCTLLNDLALRHFRYNTLYPGGWYETVRTYEARRFLEEKQDEICFSGKPWDKSGCGVIGESPSSALKLKFTGNRVDVVTFSNSGVGSAKILIDGKAPSAFPELYSCTKVMQGKGVAMRPEFEQWPMLNRVTLGVNPVVEDWIIRVKDVNEGKDFTYEIIGSVTGNDGVGNNKEKFVSRSGRITIEPQDIIIPSIFEMQKRKIVPGAEGNWKVVPMFIDVWRPEENGKPGLEMSQILAQGLENSEHTIEIIPEGNGKIPVKELVVYQPPLR